MNELQTIGGASVPATFTETAQTLAAMDFKALVDNATPQQLEAMARVYMAQHVQSTFTAAVKLAGIDYTAEKQTFLENAGRTKSPHTRRAYRNALEGEQGLEAFCNARHISVLELTAAQADDFIYWKNMTAKPATVRLAVATASSLFTWLERRHTGIITNPFRGTKARPAKQRTRPDIPTAGDVQGIIATLPPRWAAAVSLMAYRGLRIGALAGLSIKGLRFVTRSKGHDISGDLPTEALRTVKSAGLELRHPFGDMTAAQLQHAVTYELEKAYKAGAARAVFSPHKFRHFYAAAEYTRDRDIKRVRDLLGHSSIAVTENYLRGLDVID